MIKKISDDKWNGKLCFHREHNPPSMIVLLPGTYEHTCPGCGKVTTFTIHAKQWVARI